MPEPFVAPPGTENDDLSGGFKAFVIVMLIMVIASISLRFWSRSLTVRGNLEHGVARFWWDDWVALAAVVCRFFTVSISGGIFSNYDAFFCLNSLSS